MSFERNADVIVVGAGAAGLAAARLLGRASLSVVLLEARDRIGGRVWTQTVGGAMAELGAEFVHGRAEIARGLLRDAGIAVVEVGDDSWEYTGGELRRDEDDFLESAAIFKDALDLDADETVEAYLQRFGGDPSKRSAIELARAFVEGFDAADPAIASVKSIAEEFAAGTDESAARPAGGYAAMFALLHAAAVDAGADVRLRSVVKRIAWRRGAVTIDAADGAGNAATLHARAAIVTVPAGVLRRRHRAALAFEPELPAAKRESLGYVEMGDVVKVVLAFRTPFWEELCGGRYRDAAFFRAQSTAFPVFWTQYPVRSTAIAAWAGGPKAAALGNPSPEAAIDRALTEFGTLLGETALARRELEAARVHDWGNDPFSCGAYSYVRAGGKNVRSRLAAPVEDTLFFAGEATSLDGQGGTVNGALKSGERAATEVLARCRS